MASDTLPVSEIFGPVWQGEGPYTGRLCSFVRLGLCNLACSWCDTPYTWDHSRYDVKAECPPTSVEDIVAQVWPHHTPLVVLSGGEPLVHANNPALQHLLQTLAVDAKKVHVETNGTLTPPGWLLDKVEHFTVSPKLRNSGRAHKGERLRPHALETFSALAMRGQACFKFVCTGPRDVIEAASLADHLGLEAHHIWIMPEGVTADGVLDHARDLVGATQQAGFNLTLRQQVLLHGAVRGV